MCEPTAIEFDFVEGAYSWPPRPEIISIYGASQPSLSYYDGSAPSALTAIDDLAAYVTENGPYSAVIGFSMGGSLAATLLLRPHDGEADRPAWAVARNMIRSAVFLSSTRPWNTMELRQGRMEKVSSSQVGLLGRWNSIHQPTVHIRSPADPETIGESDELSQMCQENRRGKAAHTAGHAVPADPAHVKVAATAIQKLLAALED
ncbi:hypothetical protein RRF57_001976 [Xylaria bambusicola]|uniref:Serine hydrolase domain-containing protein n=1 Tax=Xylaria bambusicola TaxID=326684 RepID=A0AAN7UJK2_9PEZI